MSFPRCWWVRGRQQTHSSVACTKMHWLALAFAVLLSDGASEVRLGGAPLRQIDACKTGHYLRFVPNAPLHYSMHAQRMSPPRKPANESGCPRTTRGTASMCPSNSSTTKGRPRLLRISSLLVEFASFPCDGFEKHFASTSETLQRVSNIKKVCLMKRLRTP